MLMQIAYNLVKREFAREITAKMMWDETAAKPV